MINKKVVLSLFRIILIELFTQVLRSDKFNYYMACYAVIIVLFTGYSIALLGRRSPFWILNGLAIGFVTASTNSAIEILVACIIFFTFNDFCIAVLVKNQYDTKKTDKTK